MKEVLVDIGVIAEYLKTGKGLLPSIYEKYKMKITATTYAELLASVTFKDTNLEKEVSDFVDKYFEVISVDKDIALEVAKLMREFEMNLASSVVAATSKVRGLELVTDNKKAFEKVQVQFMEL